MTGLLECKLVATEVVAQAMYVPIVDDSAASNVSSSCTIVYKLCYFRTGFRTKRLALKTRIYKMLQDDDVLETIDTTRDCTICNVHASRQYSFGLMYFVIVLDCLQSRVFWHFYCMSKHNDRGGKYICNFL
jgi:hypothetical protein